MDQLCPCIIWIQQKLLSSAGVQRTLAASSAQKNCGKEKRVRGSWVGSPERGDRDNAFSWTVPSQSEADRVRQWPVTPRSRLLLRDSRSSNCSAPTWKIPPGPGGWAGSSSQVVFGQRTFKILHCKPGLGIFLRAISCSLSHQWVFWES